MKKEFRKFNLNEDGSVKEDTILEGYFEDCKKGEMGVMPYSEGQGTITFVWHNHKGYGREAKLNLTKEGMEEALKLYKEIEKLNKK